MFTARPNALGSSAPAGTTAGRTARGVVASTSPRVSSSVIAGHPVPRRLIRRRRVVDDGVDHRAGLLDGQADAFAGQGVLVPRRVAHQQHPSRDPARNHLPQRAAAAWLPVAGALQVFGQPREPGEVGSPTRQDRDADQVRFDRRHVRLAPTGPIHFDELRPHRHPVVPAHAIASRCSGRRFDSDGAPDRRMQSVGCHQPFRPHTRGRHPMGVLLDAGHPRPDPFGVLLFGARRQRRMQRGASHAPARPGAKQRFGAPTFAHVGDPAKGHAGRVHAE